MKTETFHLPDQNDTSVPVHIPSEPNAHTHSVTSSELLNFPAFRTWLRTLKKSLALQQTQPDHPFRSDPYKLWGITVQNVDRFGGPNGRIGFVKLSAEVANEAGHTQGDKGGKLPGSVFLRGGTVGMLVILRPQGGSSAQSTSNDDEAYAVLTVQPRVPAGSLAMPELPAGMLDDAGSFAGAAAKEMEEELGLNIKENELFDMTGYTLNNDQARNQREEDIDPDTVLPPAIFTSPGGQDEHMALFLYQKEVVRDKLFKEWAGKLTGVREHSEKITLKLCKLRDLWKEGARDAKILSALALYEGLNREGVVNAGNVSSGKSGLGGVL